MQELYLEALKKIRDGKSRKFKQSIDLVMNLKNMDMNKAENKINLEFSLPHPTGKVKIIGFFADNLIPQVKQIENVRMIRRDEVESYRGKKKAMKKLASECYCFLSEAPIMPMVGKIFGQVLAPRGKMPKPIPPTISDPSKLIEINRNTIRVALKKAPVFQLSIGTEEMEDEKIIENIERVVSSFKEALPRGKEQLRNIMLKTTMGTPVTVNLNIKGKK